MAHKTTLYLSDEEYQKLRKMSYEENKSMGAVIRERLGFLSSLEANMAAIESVVGVTDATLGIIPKTATEAAILQEAKHTKPSSEAKKAFDRNFNLCKHGAMPSLCKFSKCKK